MKALLRNIMILTLALLFYYAVAYLTISITINSAPIATKIIANGGDPRAQVAASVQALFPIPFVLWIMGVALCKWVVF